MSTVACNGENYTLTANFRAEDGCVVEAKYEGPIDFENKVTGPVGDHKTNFTQGEVSYMGSTDEMSTFRLMLWDGNMLDRDDENDQYLFEEGRRNTMLFITPLTMATLSKNPILVEFFDPENGAWNSHVSLGEWADLQFFQCHISCSFERKMLAFANNSNIG